MRRGVNKAIIVGFLGNDPEIKSTQSGAMMATISVATSESWTDKHTGQKQERTEWHRVVFFNKLAEIAGQYLKKGSKVYVEGSLRTRKWQDQQGVEKYTTEIMGNEMQMLDSKQDGGAQNSEYAPQSQQRSAQAPQQSAPASYARQPQPTPQQDHYDDFDDLDIPF